MITAHDRKTLIDDLGLLKLFTTYYD